MSNTCTTCGQPLANSNAWFEEKYSREKLGDLYDPVRHDAIVAIQALCDEILRVQKAGNLLIGEAMARVIKDFNAIKK